VSVVAELHHDVTAVPCSPATEHSALNAHRYHHHTLIYSYIEISFGFTAKRDSVITFFDIRRIAATKKSPLSY